MSFTDDLGTWSDLGNIEPSFNEWRNFFLGTIQGETFRLLFNSPDWTKKANTWLWIRHEFYNGDTTLAQKVYPRIQPVIIDLPIPKMYVNAGIIVTSISIKKGGKFKLGITPHVPWSVTVHEKLF